MFLFAISLFATLMSIDFTWNRDDYSVMILISRWFPPDC